MHHLLFISHCYNQKHQQFHCHPTCEPDVAALAKPLFDNTLSTGADDSGMHNNDSKSDLRSGY